MSDSYNNKIELRKSLLDQMKSLPEIFQAIDLMLAAIKSGHSILVFGNGGSATQASHFAAELVNKYYLKRKPIPAIALTDNCGNITSIANDFDFKYVFSKQVEALGKPGDIAMGITTSGSSENVLEALKAAQKKRLKTIGLCGSHSDKLTAAGADLIVSVGSDDTPAIQEIHLFVLHIMAEKLEAEMFGETRHNGD